jgi:hypothetical protein
MSDLYQVGQNEQRGALKLLRQRQGLCQALDQTGVFVGISKSFSPFVMRLSLN